MYNFLSKYGQLAAFLLGALITAIFLVSVFSGSSDFSAMPEEEQMQSSIFNFGLYSALALIVICAIIALAFGIFYMIFHFRQSLKAVIGIVVLVVIFIIGYSIADPDGTGQLAQTILEENVQDTASKVISAGMTTTFVLGILAIASLVLFEIYNLVK
jgi:hypothetical protein